MELSHTIATQPPTGADIAANPKALLGLWLLGGLLSAGVAATAWRYLFGVGPVPEVVATNALRNPWLLMHVGTASLALLIGPFQFWRSLRISIPRLHRWAGRLYVAACVAGGLSGLVLALGASTGLVSTAGFGLLAIAWLYTTVMALWTAMNRRFVEHRAWMIRSFALTFAAVTLRMYLPVAIALPIAFEDSYRAISFLCWVPNLLVAEAWLPRRARPLR